MKKTIASLIITFISLCSYAQSDVTQFLGIPVDGSKAEMIQKLKAKGFHSSSYDKDILEGNFNGTDVNVHIATNGNKVCRIMVCDANSVDERSIKIRFNKLCHQFENNPKYISVETELIPDDENISYEIAVHKKRYEAIYYQRLEELSDTALQDRIIPIIYERYNEKHLNQTDEERKQELMAMTLEYILELCHKRPVWFMISEFYGKYYITMFYDNEYNRANGEDL